jgi:GNAT superfamily N-acetyltransferase
MAGPSQFRVEILDPDVHRREEFSCESSELTGFFRTRARQDPGLIAGFYTLSASSIELEKLPVELTRKLPRYPRLPATLLGRLARASAFKGQGIGDLLMVEALKRSYASSSVIGSIAVVVDPKDGPAKEFYQAFGFQPLDEQKMFLPMKAIPEWLGLEQPGHP